MKTFLLSFLFIACMAISTKKTSAQCAVSNIVIQNAVVIGSTANSCTAKFDVTFNIENNSGNKYIFIHAWLQADYPNYFKCVDGQSTINGSIAAPKAADLGNEFLNIGLNNNGPTLSVLSTYPADGSVQLTTIDEATKIVLPDGSANIILKGVTVVLPVACTTPIVIVSDLWASQSANAQRAHCVDCGIRNSSGFLTVFGAVNCVTLNYSGTITNNTGTAINGFYRVFADVNGDGYFTPTTDTLIRSNTTFSVAANGSTTITGAVPLQNKNQNLFIVITQTSGAASGASRVILFRSAQCGTLPVTFRSFTANRINSSNALLQWETELEINNSGFAIERMMGNNKWIQVSFIPSAVLGGNSSSNLSYSFTDPNSNKGVTQYRIRQVDLDGRALFSDVKLVRGDVQKGKITLYPNPSADGNVNIAFDNKEAIRDITVTDMFGRIVKQLRGNTGNTMRIENLLPGIYMVRVVERETGNQSIERITISKN